MSSIPQPSTSTGRRRLAQLCALGALAVSAALPAVASADSIAYLKDGNVHLGTTDGARQFQVTADGGWTGVSQSDNGVLVGAKNRKLFRLNSKGGVANEITTAMQSANWNGPYDIAVSPDGTRVAYGFLYQRVVEDPNCPFDPSQCQSTSVFSGVAYSNTDGPASGVPMHTGWSYPAWADNATLMHSDPDGVLNKDVVLRGFGSGNNTATQWFSRNDIPRLRDGDLRGKVMAFIGGHGGEILTVWRYANLGEEAGVEGCIAYGEPTGGRFGSPSLSPDARRMVWHEGDGVWTDDLPDLSGGCAGPSGNARLLIPGGSSPDWGGAEVAQEQPTVGGGDQGGGDQGGGQVGGGQVGGGQGGGGQGGGGQGGQKGGPQPAAGVRLTVARTRLRAALKRGLKITVRNATGIVRVGARLDARTARKVRLGRKAITVAQGTAKARPGGTPVVLRFTKRAARALARSKRVKVTIAVAGDDARETVTLVR